MRVILHADDFGYDNDTTEATIELLETGALTSASIMATMPATEVAMRYAAKHPEHSYGVHLTYVDGLCPAIYDSCSTLLDNDGVFFPSNVIRHKALLFTLRRSDIVKESLAQIRLVQKAGIRISHLDSHGHIHKFPSFLVALPEIVTNSGICKIRRVQNVFVTHQRLSPTTVLNRAFDRCIAHAYQTTDYFYMSANSFDTNWADSLLLIMESLPKNAILEVGVHPGHKDNREQWRFAEYNDIKEFAVKIINSNRHQLITWNEL